MPKFKFTCVACSDTGKNSKGGPCHPCLMACRIPSPFTNVLPEPTIQPVKLGYDATQKSKTLSLFD